MRYIQGVSREQKILFPESVDEYIAENNPIKFIDAFVDSLDLSELGFKHTEPELTGRPPYNPADLLKLYTCLPQAGLWLLKPYSFHS